MLLLKKIVAVALKVIDFEHYYAYSENMFSMRTLMLLKWLTKKRKCHHQRPYWHTKYPHSKIKPISVVVSEETEQNFLNHIDAADS